MPKNKSVETSGKVWSLAIFTKEVPMFNKVWSKFKAFIGSETITINVGWVFMAALAFFVLFGIAVSK